MSVNISATVNGLDALDRALDRFGKAAIEAAADAMGETGKAIITDSKANYVPVKWGVLQSTGFVEPPVIRGDQVSVRMGYGGPAAPYAEIQHENLQFNHPRQGQAKYLERPFLIGLRGLAAAIASAIRARTGS